MRPTKTKRAPKSAPMTEQQQEMILNMRAAGEKISKIVEATGLQKYQIRGLIERSRKRGDARAALITSSELVKARHDKIRAMCEADIPIPQIVEQMAGELAKSRTIEIVRIFERKGHRPKAEEPPKEEVKPQFAMAESLGIEPVIWSSKVRGWHDAMGREGEPAPILLPRLRFLEGARS